MRLVPNRYKRDDVSLYRKGLSDESINCWNDDPCYCLVFKKPGRKAAKNSPLHDACRKQMSEWTKSIDEWFEDCPAEFKMENGAAGVECKPTSAAEDPEDELAFLKIRARANFLLDRAHKMGEGGINQEDKQLYIKLQGNYGGGFALFDKECIQLYQKTTEDMREDEEIGERMLLSSRDQGRVMLNILTHAFQHMANNDHPRLTSDMASGDDALDDLRDDDNCKFVVTYKKDGNEKKETVRDPDTFDGDYMHIAAHFTLHFEPMRIKLLHTWALAWSSAQPLDDIKEYFGEKVALYFAWLGYYVHRLIIPSAVGMFLLLTQVYTVVTKGGTDNIFVPLYALFMALWATLTVEGWKREQSRLRLEWFTQESFNEDNERPRPDYESETRWNPIESDHTEVPMRFTNPIHGSALGNLLNSCNPEWFTPMPEKPEEGTKELEEWTEKKEEQLKEDQERWKDDHEFLDGETFRTVKYILGGIAVTLMVGFVIAVTFAIFEVRRLCIQNFHHTLGAALGGMLTAVAIMIFDKFYGEVAEWLTEKENHRLPSEHENSKITKTFVFSFINSYFSLIHVAFLKNHIVLFGVYDPCPHHDCMPALGIQLATVFGTQIVLGQIIETAVPKIEAFFDDLKDSWEKKQLDQSNKSKNRSVKKTQIKTREELDYELEAYEGVFDEYSEMIMQFGYVTMFAAAFPLAPTLALANNIIELRTDALKMLTLTRRPPYECASSIGNWLDIMELVASLGIVTNVAILGFTSDGLKYFVPALQSAVHGDYIRLWLIVLIEHTLIMVKVIVQAMIDDVDPECQDEFDRKKFNRDQTVIEHKERMKRRNEKDKLREAAGLD